MIIILGPDASGKTTLAKKLGLPYHHFDKDSEYNDYLKPLCELKLLNAVLDRHCICEYAYATVMERKFKFSMKEWHNLMLLTLMQKPVIILCTHKPAPFSYSREQYLPYDKWDECLRLYRHFLNTHYIPYLEYDYITDILPTDRLHLLFTRLEEKYRSQMSWWVPMWEAGYGAIGSVQPKVLLVAERLGPNNMNNLPFETGPTGYMLSDMLTETGTPLGKFAVTNLVKSFRRDTRSPNEDDLKLLRVELENMKPEKVVFMGSTAKRGIKVAKELGIEYTELVHLGYYHYQRTTDMSGYHAEWRKIMGVIPTLSLRRKADED